MRIRIALPDKRLSGEVIEAALEAVTRAAAREVRDGLAPTAAEGISAGVKWRPEAFPDGEHFDLPSTVVARGWGDCDDLAPWHAGSLRATGRDPKARAVVRRSGPQRWHVVVRRGDGSVEDPSVAAGMRSSVSGCDGSICGTQRETPLALPADGALVAVPDRRGLWHGRLDLPWAGTPHHLSARAVSPDAARAIYLAATGGLRAADAAPAAHRAYARQLLEELLRRRTPEEHAVGFLPALAAAAPGLASSAVSLLRGKKGGKKKGGAPPKGGGPKGGMTSAPLPGGGHIAWAPQGPIIVRF